MTISVESQVRVYEVAGREPPLGNGPEFVKVRSHWNRRKMVVIETPGGKEVTVLAADLIAAVTNATRTGSI